VEKKRRRNMKIYKIPQFWEGKGSVELGHEKKIKNIHEYKRRKKKRSRISAKRERVGWGRSLGNFKTSQKKSMSGQDSLLK